MITFFIVYLGTSLFTSALSASPKLCSPYPHVLLDHGTVHRIAHQKYTFKCDKGYFLASERSVRCFRGNWTSINEPKCLRIQGQCDDPPIVDHAIAHGEERQVGAKVKYICDEGFILLGHSELTCSKNEHWNKRAPVCMDESEPLENVAERLKNSFVVELSYHSSDTPEGRLLDKASLLRGLDLYLLIDRSSSVDPVHLEDAKTFVKFLLRRFAVRNGSKNKMRRARKEKGLLEYLGIATPVNIQSGCHPERIAFDGTRAAVVTFGTEVEMVFGIDNENISDHQAAAAVVNSIEPNGGGTNMEGALNWVMRDTGNLRERAKRALFLMSDGEPNIANPDITPQDMAQGLKNNYGFEIFTVGIGKGIRISLLNELASEPPLSHVFILKDYPDLNEVMKIIQDRKPPPPPISKYQCGYNATAEQPWLATLYIGGEPFKICSGVLICQQWVLTAASCLHELTSLVDKKDVFVVLGERHLLKDERGQTNFYVVDMRVYLHYDPRYDVVENNLALVKLNFNASMNRPACLPPTDRAVPLHQKLHINASIAGWGHTSAAKMTYAAASNLSFDMSSSSVSLSEAHECPIKKRGITLLCAGQGSKTCYGLIGSPLMAEDSSTGYQHVLGILVDRKHCWKGQNQYVELTKYLDWINQATSGCQLKHWGLAK